MKIVVVDDHVLIRDALRGVLRDLRPDSTVLEAPNAGILAALLAQRADVAMILLDLGLPDRDGMSLLAELRQKRPAVAVVVMSARQERSVVARALELGASGFIPKSAPREVMLGALRLVFGGGVYVPPEILGRNEPSPSGAAADARALGRAGLGLTERQLEVLALMMRGSSNKVICRELSLAEPTVKNHVSAILRALKAANRTEAVITARELATRWPAADA